MSSCLHWQAGPDAPRLGLSGLEIEMRLFHWFVAGTVVTAFGLAVAMPVGADPCYSQTDLSRVSPPGLRVEMPTTCPHDNIAAGYKYFPQTACTSGQLDGAQNSTWTNGFQNVRLWVNRGDDGPLSHKPNHPPGPDVVVDDGVHGAHSCFLKFSNKDIADAATKSQVSYTIGRFQTHNNKNGWRDYTRAVGLPDDHVLEWTQFVTLAPTICTGVYSNSDGTWYFATDYVTEPSSKLSTVPATPVQKVELDYERQDCNQMVENCTGRTNALIKEIAQNVHQRGYQLGIYNNPLYGSAARYNGINTSNANFILSKVDTFGILVWPFNPQGYSIDQDFDLQMSYFTAPDCTKFSLEADMKMSLANAEDLHARITGTCAFGGVEVLFDGQAAGGSCSTAFNQVLATLLGMQ